MICCKQILLTILATNLLFAQPKQTWVDSTYQSLTLDEKIGQLFMPMVFSQGDQNHYQQVFADLKKFDNDDNDWIDENDDIFHNLVIWEKTENGEDNLITLAQAGVGAIYLASVNSNFDYHATLQDKIAHLKQSSFYLKENGQPGLITGVDFIV